MFLVYHLKIGLCSLLIPEKTIHSLVPPLWKCVMYGPYFNKKGKKEDSFWVLKVNISIFTEIKNILNPYDIDIYGQNVYLPADPFDWFHCIQNSRGNLV